MRRLFYLILIIIPLLASLPVTAQFLENIDRGTVALMKESGKTFISWRLLEDDAEDQLFNIYRQEIGVEAVRQINEHPLKATCFIDSTVQNGHGYYYHVVINNEAPVLLNEGAYLFTFQYGIPYISIKLNTNARPRNVGIADLDGNKRYDFVIKYPDFNVDPCERSGYWKRSPEPYWLEAYDANGRYMWTYNMGWSVETGTWYSPYLVYDIDRDGYAEVYTKAGEGDPREIDGHVMDGREYLVKIDGRTGQVVNKTDWISKEGFETYNRWSRNFLTMAFVNATDPSIIVQRGTYSIIKTLALDKNLKQEWYWESSGKYEHYSGQGQHGIISADIDNDSKDELVNHKGEEIMKIEGKVLMVGDIIGDWREEIITGLEGELRIYSTTIPSAESSKTLIQDRMYRLGESRSTVGYYYPPQLSQFYKP